MGRCLLACQRALQAVAVDRPRRQLRAGLWLAGLILVRPEAMALALPLGADLPAGGYILTVQTPGYLISRMVLLSR